MTRARDDSVHSMEGIFLMYDPKEELEFKTSERAKIADIAPTLLALYGIKDGACEEMDGKVLFEVTKK